MRSNPVIIAVGRAESVFHTVPERHVRDFSVSLVKMTDIKSSPFILSFPLNPTQVRDDIGYSYLYFCTSLYPAPRYCASFINGPALTAHLSFGLDFLLQLTHLHSSEGPRLFNNVENNGPFVISSSSPPPGIVNDCYKRECASDTCCGIVSLNAHDNAALTVTKEKSSIYRSERRQGKLSRFTDLSDFNIYIFSFVGKEKNFLLGASGGGGGIFLLFFSLKIIV